MDQQLQSLRNGFANAPAGPVTINAAFWTAAGVTPPEGFDDAVRAAYRLPGTAAGLVVDYDRSNVSEVVDDRFSVTGVSLTFLNSGNNAAAATIEGIGTGGTPTLGIDVTPPDPWSLGTLFTFMPAAGWPLSWLLENRQRFHFTTADAEVIKRLSTDLPVIKGQNIYGEMGVPESARLLFSLVSGFSDPAGNLPASGPIILNKALGVDSPAPSEDESVILYPDVDYTAFIPESSPLTLLILEVSKPRLSIVVTTSEEKDEEGKTVYDQTPAFGFALEMALVGTDGEVPMLLAAQVGQPVDPNQSKANSFYQFSVARVDDKHRITPAAIVSLMVGQSCFSQTPPALQQYLSAVEMLGFTMSGRIGVAYPDSMGLVIGSDGGPPLLFTDPGNNQQFDIKSFALTWRMLNPFEANTRQNMFSFETVFILFPTIFKQKNGEDGGEFSVLIDQDLNMEGRFDGTASLNDILNGITGGAIGLPEGVSASFSDIYTTISPSQKSYSFGFTVDAEIDIPLISYDDRPLVQLVGMTFQLAAVTPKTEDLSGNAATVYTGAIEGVAIVGPASLNVAVNYDGAGDPPTWRLKTSLANNIDLIELMNQFFSPYQLPVFLPGSLTVEAFELLATIPSTSPKLANAGRLVRTRPARHVAGPSHSYGWRSPVRPVGEIVLPRSLQADAAPPATKSSYQVSGKIRWIFNLTDDIPVDILAEIGLNYDGNRTGQEFAGSVIGTITIDSIGATVEIGYRFGPAAEDVASLRMPMTEDMLTAVTAGKDRKVLWIAWKGFRAEYSFANETVTFSMKGWTVGSLITALVEMVDDPYFTLPSPWDVLNQISLDGLSIKFDLRKGVKYRVSASYSLPSPVNFGFFTLRALNFKQVEGKVTLAIDGDVTVPGLSDSLLFKPDGDGQDVKNMPTVPGRGNAYFHLYLLALGQRIAIYDPGEFNSTKAVIDALADIPPSAGPGLPFNPTELKKGQPYYNRSSDWLAAMHFGILQIPETDTYAIDLMVVFNDPNLYGLRLALNGDKMKVLAGLVIDVLYKKITDDIGCYQIEFTLPSVLRNLEFGAFSVTLPVIGLQIYTNGDFLIDFGFPYNMDFSRSFTVQAIILGVPVLGSGGFYFGKLSNATAPNLPVTSKGTFHPVIVFGLGAQLGIGKTIDKGILKAGFSITVFGIIEGTLAAWHPYQITSSGNKQEVQGDYYFKITGTFGIIGKLYGSIDFAIIKADVSLTVIVYVQIAYESFRKIPLILHASVQVSVKVKIDLGLFSISISLSFAASITEQLTIGHDNAAPWDDLQPPATFVMPEFGSNKALLETRTLPLPRTLFEHGIVGKPFRLDFTKPHAALLAMQADAEGDVRTPIEITAVTQFTVLAPEDVGDAQIEGGLVLMFAMDAPQAASDRSANPGEETSFGKLCGTLLPWIIASVVPESDLPLPPLEPGDVSRPLLEGILKALSDPAQAPFSAQQLVEFLAANFTITVSAADSKLCEARRAALDAGTTIFPAVDFLSMKVPDPADPTAEVTIAYDAYVTATTAYQGEIRRMFNAIAANVGSETKAPPPAATAVEDDPQPLAATVFSDYFVLLARQLVQSAIDSFDDYPYPLTPTTSLQSILDWANGLVPGQLTPTALVSANMNYPLTPKIKLDIADVGYIVQAGDTLASIAARYADPSQPTSASPADLILTNRAQNNLINAGVPVEITIDGATRRYMTQTGDDFDAIAGGLNIGIEDLSQQESLYNLTELLASAVVTTIPHVTVTTADGDTIATVIERLKVPKQSFLTAENLSQPGLFKVDPALRFAVPGLVVLPEDSLWSAILATGTLGQIAGMAARYMLHGMRLPVAPGLAIPETGFLYGEPHWKLPQTAYGVYQLTGQQFPRAARAKDYFITLTRPDQAIYDWFQLGGGASLRFDISQQTSILSKVVASAQANGYKPHVPSLEPVAETDLSPRSYGMANYVPWLTSNMADLAGICAPPATQSALRAEAESGPQAKPLLFDLSSALLSSIEKTQTSLATTIRTVKEMRPYLPVLSPSVGTSDPATSITTYTEIDNFSFATRIDFRIKRLAQDADLAPQLPSANDVVPPSAGNSGSPARPLAPFAYEIIGPNPAQSVLLERLLTAMDSEGEALVSGLFLLYADVNNGANGLTSRAASEFLSFIVQSNLSTETNPPPLSSAMLAEEAAPPPGIANKPAEFIKLLWELSTVNSGGTYLFYQLLADGTGLPSALFDDSGVATITLVATIRRDGGLAKGARIFNAVNALLTTAPIDPQSSIVEMKGVSAPAQSLTLPPGATAAQIAALYGIDLGGLGESNAAAPLRNGKQIPISGLYRQLTPDDVAPGRDPIADLAVYYSSGAVNPLTKDDILAFNPGVPVATLSVFRIPDFIYAVISSGPGASFNSMAAYYRTEVFALVYAARNVQDLFEPTTLTIDPVALAATQKLGLCNAALNLERERGLPPEKLPDDPTQQQIDAYTKATLLQLYQLLSARIVKTAFFKKSDDSAAFGPLDPPTPNPATNKADARQTMRNLTNVEADQPFLYEQAIGYGGSALVNPAPPPDTAGLPLAADNPYVGIGTLLQIGIDWLDLFGNRMPNPFNQPRVGDPPPFGDVPMLLLYTDRLMPMDTWPSTTRSYRYTGEPGEPILNISLKFDTTPYEPAAPAARGRLDAVRLGDELPIWQRNAASDLAKFHLVYFQLNQNYDGLNIPGLAGPAVTMSLVNSLLATPEHPLPASARDSILNYVNMAVVYLAARAAGNAAAAPPETSIAVSIDTAALANTSDIIRLETSIRFTRQSGLVTPPLRALNDGLVATSTIPVDGSLPSTPTANGEEEDTPAYPVALTEFALSFEKAFVTTDWQMRIGTSSADPSTPNNTRTATVWAVRMAKTSAAQGISFQIGNDPCYFAPLPIASSLQTLVVDINRYQTGASYPDGAPVRTTFTNVDPNTWLAECLTAVDDVLSVTYSTPLFQLDRLLGLVEDPALVDHFPEEPINPQAGYLTRLLQYKKTLASAISSTATSVLEQPVNDLKPIAIDKLEQVLLKKLSNANTLTCVAVLPVTNAHYVPPLPPGITAPRLFGQPQGVLGDTENKNSNDNFALSTAKIPLIADEGDGASTLAFLVTSRSAESEPYLKLALGFSLSHIEHDIHGVPGINNYEQSRWITFLTGPFDNPIKPADGSTFFAIPVALRALPVPATVVSQTGVRSAVPSNASKEPAQLKTWDYGFSYLLQQAAQDSVIAEVVFNQEATPLGALTDATPEELYKALAQFVAIYPAVARDLETYLRPIDGLTKPDNLDVSIAAAAVAALDSVVSDVASAYDAWAKAQLAGARVLAKMPRVLYQFEIVLGEGADPQTAAAQINILPQLFERDGVEVPNFLPLAKVLIDPENYAPEQVSSDPATGRVIWQYKLRSDAKDLSLSEWLPYETARLNSERTVTFEGLDLFALQNGWAGVQVARNRHLSPDLRVKTTPAFEFETAEARFANPLVPLLDIDAYSLAPVTTAQQSVSDLLKPFFTALLTPPPGIDFSEPVIIKIETVYSYNLVGDDTGSCIPKTAVPISLLPPTSTEGVTDPSFVGVVGDMAQNWFDTQQPLVNASARFDFGLTVFSGSGANNLPLMKVNALTLTAQNVKRKLD